MNHKNWVAALICIIILLFTITPAEAPFTSISGDTQLGKGADNVSVVGSSFTINVPVTIIPDVDDMKYALKISSNDLTILFGITGAGDIDLTDNALTTTITDSILIGTNTTVSGWMNLSNNYLTGVTTLTITNSLKLDTDSWLGVYESSAAYTNDSGATWAAIGSGSGAGSVNINLKYFGDIYNSTATTIHGVDKLVVSADITISAIDVYVSSATSDAFTIFIATMTGGTLDNFADLAIVIPVDANQSTMTYVGSTITLKEGTLVKFGFGDVDGDDDPGDIWVYIRD